LPQVSEGTWMPLPPKRFSWAGLLASGFVILSGFVATLFMIMAFSDSQRRDLALVVGVFAGIMLIPIWALRSPPNRAEKRPRGWWKFWRRKRKKESGQVVWRRRRGQDKNKPYGHKEVIKPKPSTFVASPRKPTDP
jgi:formate hydrogenlyase subunit 3/multisubunit Na+/H+ antiporter MnhD subunit